MLGSVRQVHLFFGYILSRDFWVDVLRGKGVFNVSPLHHFLYHYTLIGEVSLAYVVLSPHVCVFYYFLVQPTCCRILFSVLTRDSCPLRFWGLAGTFYTGSWSLAQGRSSGHDSLPRNISRFLLDNAY